MSKETPEKTIDSISREYQTHLVQVQKLEHALQQQRNMLQYRTIPKLCRPQVLTTVNPNKSLTDNFNRDYEELFFKHLERVMTNNNITLEIHKARVDNALAQFDQYLCNLEVTPQRRLHLYKKFTKNKEIAKEVHLKVERMLPQEPMSQSVSTTKHSSPSQETSAYQKNQSKCGKKRKNSKQHPKAKKITKQQHFLSKGPNNLHQPP